MYDVKPSLFAGLTLLACARPTPRPREAAVEISPLAAPATFDSGVDAPPPRRATPVAVPGPCVPVPKVSFGIEESYAGIDWQGRSFEGTTTRTVETTYDVDVDADGVADALVPQRPSPRAGSCTTDVHYAVYVMRGACGHRVGVVGPGRPLEASLSSAPDASGFRVLAFEEQVQKIGKASLVAWDMRTIRFAYERGSYQKKVPSPSDVSEGGCHHCPETTSCRLLP